ncbi:uncharacterized protein LOC132903372 [Amyelois transitella]|uniref:uncharacterized protein LOC132903372 n=1 Tax=Amyelois transitella TaxID=680683 RepID=UPI00298FBC41|nr:uncharacterized protein LOC132903372 [Amyelois transitella]
MRNYARLNKEALCVDAAGTDWSTIVAADSINEKVSLLNETIVTLFDRHAPLRMVKLKRPPCPWITLGVRMAMRKRNKAFSKFKRDRSEINWTFYKEARNRCNQMVRSAKRHYFHDHISNLSAADTWKFLKSLGFGKSVSKALNLPFSSDDINTHFSSASCLDDTTRTQTISNITSMPLLLSESFSFSLVSSDDVRKALLSIKSKAVGHDAISHQMVLLLLDFILPVLTHIINFSLSTGAFPSLWRKAFVLPLPKITNPTSLSDLRPISILPYFSKVLEILALSQLSSLVMSNSLLSHFQSGFRLGHSTSTALLKVTEDIRVGMDHGKITVLVLIDFSNAFNTVDYEVLLALMSLYNLSTTVLDWLSSYLRGRQQTVRLDQTLSSWRDLSSGVPQGGILSPLLFSIFIDSLTTRLSTSYHLYADDLQLYHSCDANDINSAVALLNNDLYHIAEWSKEFGIFVNPKKCQAIIVGSSGQLSKLNCETVSPIKFGHNNIPFCPSVKDLGLHIDPTFSWVNQVTELGWLPIPLRRKARILSMLYTILNDPCAPDYLKSKFPLLSATHARSLRSSENLLLATPAHRLGFMSNSFQVQAIRLWNSLPESIRKAPNRFAFREQVHDLLFDQ